jgi:hypothetical protein
MECKARLAFLLKTLQENYQQSNATSFVNSMKEEYPTAKSDSMDYELVFRGQLDDFISQMSINEVRTWHLLITLYHGLDAFERLESSNNALPLIICSSAL